VLESKTDWILTAAKPWKWTFKNQHTPHSDHRLLIAEISLRGYVACQNHYVKKNRGVALENCKKAELTANNINHFTLRIRKHLEKTNKSYTVIRSQIRFK
jgi:hypothetical protein